MMAGLVVLSASESAARRPSSSSTVVPTTPNPTTGFIVLVPEEQIVKLDMSVADGIKFIISLGSVAPVHVPAERPPAMGAPT